MTIELSIDASTEFATAYINNKPVATFQRRRVYDKGPYWRCFATDGSLMFSVHMPTEGARYLIRRLERFLARSA